MMATPNEGFNSYLTPDEMKKILEGFFKLPEGALIEQADGSHIMRVHDEVMVYQAGEELSLGQAMEIGAAMIPTRKVRIEALERKAANESLPKEERMEAWNEAGRLKAVQKAQEREGNKD